MASLFVFLIVCAVALVPAVRCQYENYSPENFPHADLMPLDSAYGFALERYGARDWAESARYMELSLRLHRLLKESEGRCSRACAGDNLQDTDMDTGLRIMQHILTRAACVKKCKAGMAVFSNRYPKAETLEAFGTRTPYRYLQFAYYQSLFLRAVLLYNAGDFSRSVSMMEDVCVEYFRVYEECVSAYNGRMILCESRQGAGKRVKAQAPRFSYRVECQLSDKADSLCKTVLQLALQVLRQQVTFVSSSIR
ncbi:Cartilage-associated protein [Bagarius yarrelli]|uniref:Cartilage-associated protein n=1 Tax=Bagarius yarrelli TaxID=175774 RepID=A0A556TV27_BAGYA|nr:Cartilage-associated protein [Bagarius yarrelli]